MKTRAEIYGNEATDLLRIVTMYPASVNTSFFVFTLAKKILQGPALSFGEAGPHFSNRRRWLFPSRANTKN